MESLSTKHCLLFELAWLPSTLYKPFPFSKESYYFASLCFLIQFSKESCYFASLCFLIQFPPPYFSRCSLYSTSQGTSDSQYVLSNLSLWSNYILFAFYWTLYEFNSFINCIEILILFVSSQHLIQLLTRSSSVYFKIFIKLDKWIK